MVLIANKVRGNVARFVVVLAAFFAFSSVQALAQLGWEGPTGVFVTPLASVAGSPAKGLGKPVVAYHFLAGGPVIGDFSTVSVTEGFAKRFEFGYTAEIHAAGSDAISSVWGDNFDIVHAKANLIPENYNKQKWVPAISVGGIYRVNDHFGRNLASALSGYGVNEVDEKTASGDIYVVGTKVITQISKKVPFLLSGGVRGTNSVLWGLAGNSDFTARGFGAVAAVIALPCKATIIPAFEISQQPQSDKLNLTGSAKLFDIPTSEVYAVRIIPSPKYKLNIDAGVLHAGGWIDNANVRAALDSRFDVNARARVAFGMSYVF